MNVISSSELRKRVSDAVNTAHYAGERTIIRRSGRDFAAVVSIEDLALLRALEDREDLRIARHARNEADGKSHDPIKEELGV